jgi:hypothetical protein
MSKNTYIPFGEEWEKEMMKWKKKDLISTLKEKLKEPSFREMRAKYFDLSGKDFDSLTDAEQKFWASFPVASTDTLVMLYLCIH